MEKKRNILLIVVDCLRADHVYEDKGYTPTIHALRDKGFSFLNTTSSTTTTTPCFSSILTGLYPFETGIRSLKGSSLKKGVKNIAEVMKEQGYNTYAELTGPMFEEAKLNKGFDEYNHRSHRTDTIFTEWGDKFIKRLESGHYKEPYFMIFHIWPLHIPRYIKEDRNDKKFGKTPYARSLSSIDWYLGKLLEVLDKDTIIMLTADHAEDIESSDMNLFFKKVRRKIYRTMLKHNITKSPSWRGMKNIAVGHGYHIYDSAIRIPYVVYGRDMIPKGKTEAQIRQIDIPLTLADIAGSDYTTKYGKSVMPMIEGKEKKSRDCYMEAVGPVVPKKEEWTVGLRIDNKYKFIYAPFREDFEEELYDLEKDPNERKNIASKNKDLVAKYKKQLEDMDVKEMVGEKMSDEDEQLMKQRLKDLGYM